MKIKDSAGGRLIILSQAFDNRAKILNTFYFVVFFSLSLSFFGWFLGKDLNLGSAVIILGGGVMLILSYRFANKAAQSEKIFIGDKGIQLIQAGLFGSKKRSFDKSRITNFRYLEKPELSRHPLEGESLDYLGFGVEQKMINELHGDKKLAFDYDGKTVAFGDNIYSWDFEELQPLLSAPLS